MHSQKNFKQNQRQRYRLESVVHNTPMWWIIFKAHYDIISIAFIQLISYSASFTVVSFLKYIFGKRVIFREENEQFNLLWPNVAASAISFANVWDLLLGFWLVQASWLGKQKKHDWGNQCINWLVDWIWWMNQANTPKYCQQGLVKGTLTN